MSWCNFCDPENVQYAGNHHIDCPVITRLKEVMSYTHILRVNGYGCAICQQLGYSTEICHSIYPLLFKWNVYLKSEEETKVLETLLTERNIDCVWIPIGWIEEES